MEKALLVKNQTAVCVIDDYTQDGMGVAHIDGRVLFVNGAYIGDVCTVKVVKAGKSVSYGIIQELITESPSRISPACGVFPKCGGCNLLHVSYQEELRWKANMVVETLRRIGGVSITPEALLEAQQIYGYRNKAVFPVGIKNGEPVTGFYRFRTNDIVPNNDCLLQNAHANNVARAFRRWMSDYRSTNGSIDLMGIRHLFVRVGSEGVIICVISTAKAPKIALAEKLVSAFCQAAPVVGVLWDHHSGIGNAILSGRMSVLWGKAKLNDILCGLEFAISPMSFYQVNHDQAEKLYGRACEYAGNFSRAVDLYCGTGTLTLCLAKNGGKVTGIDIVPEAIADARENARRNKIAADFICADAGKNPGILRHEDGNDFVVLVDPPRKGLSAEAINTINSIFPERIVYISCNPATLARDIKLLPHYRPERLSIVDMFPRTTHVECVVLLTRYG